MDRIPRRYWMCLVVGMCTTVFESIYYIENETWDIITTTGDVDDVFWGDFNVTSYPYVPGAYTCPHPVITHNMEMHIEKTENARFQWNQNVRHGVFLVLYWVPVITHLPSGVWADLYGGHRIIFWSLLSSSLLHLFTPFAVSLGDAFYVGITILRRVFDGMALPALVSLLAHWASPQERTTFVAALRSFAELGVVIRVTAIVVPWWYVFYASSAVTFLAALVWWKTARLWHDILIRSPGPDLRVTAKKVPLLRLVTAPILLPLYMLAVASEGSGTFAGRITIAQYLHEALMLSAQVPITNTGFINYVLISFFSYSCVGLAVGIASDHLVTSGLAGLPTVRRTFLATAAVGAALSMLLLIPAQCNGLLAIACSVAFEYFVMWQRVVLWTLPMDVAPCLAGTLFSLINIVSALGARVMFQSAARFTRSWGVGNLQVWAVVFVAFALAILILPVPYLVWGPFFELPWARRPSLDAAPNTFKSRLARVLLSMTTIVLICIVIIVISIIL